MAELTVPTPETTRRRRSRLMSTGSVMAAAAAIPAADDHNISNTEAMVHLIKATVGGGCLSMPDAFRNVGWVIGIVGTIVIGMSVLNMMSTIVRLSQALRSGKYAAAILAEQNKNADELGKKEKPPPSERPRNHPDELLLPPMDYPDTVAAVFQYGARGRFARWAPVIRNFCSAALVTTYYGVNIIYVCIVAGTCKQLVDQYTADGAENSWARSLHGRSIRWYPAVTALLIIPVGMVRLMKYLVPFSVVANACLVTGVGVVFYFLFTGDARGALAPEERAKVLVWPATRWSLFAGSTLCSMESIGMLLHIENAMRHPTELAGPPAYTLHKAMLVIVAINGALGLCGYLRYGERCAGSISLSLPPDNRLAEVIKIMIALGILLTYGLQLTVTADLAWQGLRGKLVKNAGDEEDTDDTDKLSPRLTAYYYGMRFSLILGTILVATAVPDIGPLVSLIGSVGFSSLGLMVPVLMETVWYWYPKNDDGDGDDGDEPTENGRAIFTVDGVAVSANGNGGGGVAMSANGNGGGVAVSANGGRDEKRTMTDRCRHRRRVMRHVKNVALFALATFAMVGGAYYNVRDIAALAKGGEPESLAE